MASDFTVQLIVGIRDLFSREAREIARRARDLDQALDVIERESDQADESLRDLARGAERAGQDLHDAERDMDRTGDAAEDLARGARRAGDGLEQAGRGAEEAGQDLDRAGDAAEDLARGARRAADDVRRAGDEIEDTGREAREAAGGVEDMAEALGSSLADGAKAFLAVAGGGALGAQILELDAQMRQLAAGTTLTVQQAQAMEAYFRGTKRSIVGSDYTQVQTAVRAVMQETQLRGEAAFKLAEQAMMLNQVHPEQDTADVIKAAAAAARAWNTDPATAVDLFATALERAGDNGQDLLDTFHEYSGIAAEAGYSLEQFTAALMGGKQAGAFQYDKVADVLKEGFKARITDADIWQQITEGTATKPGTLDELLPQGEAQRMRALLTDLRTAIQLGGNVDQLQARVASLRQELALELSGADGRAAGHGPKAQALETQISEAERQAQTMAQGAGSLGESWGRVLVELADIAERDATAARNVIEGVFGSLGAEDLTAPQLRGMGESILQAQQQLGAYAGATARAYDETTTFFDRLRTAWDRLQTQIEIGAMDMAGWAAPLGDGIIWLLNGAADLAEKFRGMALGLTTAAAAGGALSGLGMVLGALGAGAALASAPIWLIALALGAVVAGGYEVIANWGAIKATAAAVWASALASAQQAWAGIVSGASAMIARVRAIISGSNLYQSGMAFIRTFVSGIKAAAAEVYAAVQATLAKARALLPFSDAKEGPLSDLTLSGRRLVTTLAGGISGAGPEALGGPLAEVLAGALGALALDATGRTRLIAPSAWERASAGLPSAAEAAARPARGGDWGHLASQTAAAAPGVTVNQHFTLNLSGARGAEDIGGAVVEVIRQRSTDLILELERAMEDLWSRQAYRTHGM